MENRMTASEVGVLGTNGRFHFRPLAGLGTQPPFGDNRSSTNKFGAQVKSVPQ
jgi:hypothetical protein